MTTKVRGHGVAGYPTNPQYISHTVIHDVFTQTIFLLHETIHHIDHCMTYIVTLHDLDLTQNKYNQA